MIPSRCKSGSVSRLPRTALETPEKKLSSQPGSKTIVSIFPVIVLYVLDVIYPNWQFGNILRQGRWKKKTAARWEICRGNQLYSSVLPEPEVMSYKWKTVIPQSQDRLDDTEWTRNSWSMRSLFYPKQKTKDRHGNVILRYLHTPFSLIYWKLRITF